MTSPHPTIPDHAWTTPDKPALIMGESGHVLTFRQLDDASDRLAHQFAGLGLAPGDVIGVMMENRPEFVIATWAAHRSGLLCTPINHHLRWEEVEYIIADSGCRILLTSPAQAAIAACVRESHPDVAVWVCGEAWGATFTDASGSALQTAAYQALQGINMPYSSGTSGRPKGIRRHLPREPFGQSLQSQDIKLRTSYGMAADTVLLMPSPLYHQGPLVWTLAAQRAGGTAVIMAKFDAEEALKLIDRHRVTHAWFVPTMFSRMLRLPPSVRGAYDVSSIRAAVHSAAPCPVDVKHAMIDWFGPKIFEFYGSSEGHGFVSVTPEEWLKRPGTVGHAKGAHIVGEDGQELPAGEIGEIYFETAGPAFEYHGAPEKTAESRHPNGWVTVGDIGYLDDEGWLFLSDRKSNMIIAGGVNIYPQEAENVLQAHPSVADVAVIGVPDADMGEQVKAVVQLVEGVSPSDQLAGELVAFCQARLSKFKCPRSVDFAETLPRGENGKLMKRELRERYWPTGKRI